MSANWGTVNVRGCTTLALALALALTGRGVGGRGDGADERAAREARAHWPAREAAAGAFCAQKLTAKVEPSLPRCRDR
ncbi:unnamed protein product, partial [Iphiclides podalirius]